MAKITSNEYTKVAWVLDSSMTTAEAAAPDAATLNAAIDLSPAIAWQDWSLGATDSDDVDDRGITDPGNAVTRGFANFEGTLSFFRDANPNDLTSPYVQAFETFRTPRTYGYLVLRVAEKHWSEDFAAGDRVSVFRFVADAITDDTEGDDSVKFTVNFLPQGILYPYTVVQGATASALAGIDPTATLAVGDKDVLAPTLDGTDVRATSNYTSSDASIVRVSTNGVRTAVTAGTATITVTHPGAAAPVEQTATVA